VYRRRGRMIGSLIVGGLLLFAFIYALFDPRPVPPAPFVKSEIGETERALRLGAPVVAADGTQAGTVAGVSRSSTGNIERIRVITSLFEPHARIFIVRQGAFIVDANSVRLALSVGEVKALPRVMTEDGSAG
jgi:hypothetical protein